VLKQTPVRFEVLPVPSSRSAAFVIPHPYVDALACFREPIKQLADEGWRIDLYTTLSPVHPVPFFGRDSVRVIPLEMSRLGAIDLVRRLATARPRYRYIVTVPQWGLHYCGIAARLGAIPMACISDELRSDAEASTPQQKRWKARERRAHQRCRFTIALSAERADFIRAENRLGDNHPIFIVPNAPRGASRRLSSRYFQDALALPAERRVLLHAGSMWWRGATDLVEATRTWSGNNWVVVFQGRFASNNGWHDTSHARFAPAILPADLLDYAVSSASIGLALYDESRINNRLMSTASGKVSLYMKNGLPVIATRAGGFEWIEREGCGVCVSTADEIPSAADRIWAEYDQYAGRVRRYYDQQLEFCARFRPVAELMAAR
jgi:hypothetical protein